MLLVFARLFYSKKYLTLPIEVQNKDHKKWADQFACGSLLTGIIWGLLPSLFDLQMTTYFSLIICIHAGYISASS